MASNIARRIKDLRSTMGWTVAQLAEIVGRDDETVSGWERGTHEPPQSALKYLVDQFEWSVAMFVEGGPMPSEVPDVVDRATAAVATEEPPPSPPPPPARRKTPEARRRTSKRSRSESRPQRAATKRSSRSRSRAKAVPETVEDSGWLFDRGSKAEEQFRTMIRRMQVMTRGMVGPGDVAPAEEVKQAQLAICRMVARACELASKPVPAFVHEVYNELIAGEFD